MNGDIACVQCDMATTNVECDMVATNVDVGAMTFVAGIEVNCTST